MNHFDPADKTVLVTGASGFVGSAIVKALVQAKARVISLCRNVEKGKLRFADLAGAVEVRRWSMADPLAYSGPADAIVHAAGHGNPAAYAAEPLTVMRDNYLGCLHILDFAASRKISRFMFISSGEAYGTLHLDRRIAETDQGVVDPLNPRFRYPLGKMAAENLCLAYGDQHSLSVSIARLCHIYGPGADPNDTRITCQFPLAAARGRDIILKSAGEQLRSFCYIDDAAQGVLAILTRGSPGEVYNVADESAELTVREFAEKVAMLGGVRVLFDVPTQIEEQNFNPMPRATFSTAKLRALGWALQTNFNLGLRQTLTWLSHSK